jgi:hypothetical protein
MIHGQTRTQFGLALRQADSHRVGRTWRYTVNDFSPCCSEDTVQAWQERCDKINHTMQAAEKTVARAERLIVKRLSAKRLLIPKNRIQGFVIMLLLKSSKSSMDRTEYEQSRA